MDTYASGEPPETGRTGARHWGGLTVKSIGYFHASEEGKSPLGLGNIDFYSPSAAAVEIELDRETGELRVLQYAVVAMPGRLFITCLLKVSAREGRSWGWETPCSRRCLSRRADHKRGSISISPGDDVGRAKRVLRVYG